MPSPAALEIFRVPTETLEAMRRQHNDEIARLQMQLIRYRTVLEENGIEPPDGEAAELLQMWRECQALVAHAHRFVMDLGPAKELLGPSFREQAA